MLNASRLSVRGLQRAVLAISGSFVLIIVVVVMVRSQARNSLLEGTFEETAAEERQVQINAPVREDSALHIQQFHRSEIKDGKLAWEIHAEDAHYYAEQQLAHVNKAKVQIYRDGGSSISIKADAGRMLLDGQKLRSSELEGNVEVVLDGELTMQTDRATYDVDAGAIQVPGLVKIKGPGYTIEGQRLHIDVESRKLHLQQDVETKIMPGANASGGLKEFAG